MVVKVLDQIVKLFAFFSKLTVDETGYAMRSFMELYLTQNFSQETVEKYLNIYDVEIESMTISKIGIKHDDKLFEEHINLVRTMCGEIDSNLETVQKTKVSIHIIEFLNYLKSYTSGNESLEALIRFAINNLSISEQILNNILAFAHGQIHQLPNKENLVIASGVQFSSTQSLKTHYIEHLTGKIYFYLIPDANFFLLYIDANDELELAGQSLVKRRIYYFEKGDSIRGKHIIPIYFSTILSHFIKQGSSTVSFVAENISYNFPNSDAGVKELSLSANSGELVAIMGGSGSGKTTCISLLNGTIKPKTGTVKINGIDIFANKNSLEGIMGFVPQDDLLFEELTVRDNLYFNAALCNGKLSSIELETLVDKTLKTLKLFEIKHLTVGTPLNKVISGGQRKRLNIALELIREPHILFLDEPTSGLSSSDSEHLIDLLKEIAMRGKIVILNIHQPSSDIYKLFDKLLILDNFGYSVFYGNQLDAIVYLKSTLELADADKSECTNCGYVNPEQIFKLVEMPKLDSHGNKLTERLISPQNWHKLRLENNVSKSNISKNNVLTPEAVLPTSNLEIPNKFKQFRIFFHRNFKSKISDKQFLLISFLEAPVLGLILGFLTRYTDPVSNRYTFADNENIPAFLFMAILVSLFLGMIISAEEIINDRKILKREAFLNLSKGSFLNAKISLIFAISAIQMSSFLLVSFWILGIKDLFWSYFLILWITSCFANIVGMLLSSVLKSKVAIYVSIPFILIPQIILAGTIVKFDKLNSAITSQEYVPVIGDLMVSRWAYEALAVNQFINNSYYTNIYPYDKERAEATYMANFFIPELENLLGGLTLTKTKEDLANKKKVTKWGFEELSKLYPKVLGSNHPVLLVENQRAGFEFLKKVKEQAVNAINKSTAKKDAFIAKFDKNDIMQKKETYYNSKLASILIANDEINKIFPYNGQLLRKFQPIFFEPQNIYGRSHFYTPSKTIGRYHIPTIIFNITIILCMTLCAYIVLLSQNYNTLQKKSQNTWNFKNIFRI